MQEENCLQKLDDDARAEFWAALALRYAKNIGIRSSSKLIHYYGSALNAINNIDTWEDSKLSSSKTSGIYSASWYDDAYKEWTEANNSSGEIILYNNYRYPSQLKELVDAPSYFYAKGNTSLLLNVCIAIVGSRKFSIEGAKKAREIAKKLAQAGITIVSGLAKGIDRNAHIGAAQAIGSTIAVLGSGLEIIYPKENEDVYKLLEENGLIISEFSPLTRPDSRNFPIRNRLISGLALGVLIVEAGLKSGSLITARTALEQNRNVYALSNLSQDFGLSSEGCQMLIEDGALAVTDHEDILRDLPSFSTILEMSKIQRINPLTNTTTNPEANRQFKKNNPALNPPPVENILISKRSKLRAEEIKSPKAKNILEKQAIIQETTSKTENELTINNLYDPASPEARILKILAQSEKLHIDNIIEESKLASSKVNATLTILELQKRVKRFTGSYFTLSDHE